MKLTAAGPLFLAFASLLSGCGERTTEYLQRTNIVRVTPADNSTGRPTLWVTLTNDQAYTEELDQLAASSQLVTWPGLMPVPSHIDMTARPGPDVASPGMSSRALVADGTPPEGSYALLLGRLSASAIVAPDLFHKLPDDRLVARVRLGPAPDIWGYATCPKEGGRTAVIVRYTEQLHATTTATPLFIKAGPPGHEVDCEGVTAPQIDRFRTDYEFLCGSLGHDDQVIVDVRPGLATQFGPEVAEGQRTLELAHLQSSVTIASGCFSIKVDP